MLAMLILFGIGILCFLLPNLYEKSIKKLGKTCTYVVTATVLGFVEDPDPQPEERRCRALFPVLNYVYNGKSYKITSNYGNYPAICMIGDKIPLDIDPEHPETHCFATFEGKNKKSFDGNKVICYILGIWFIIFGVLCFVFGT